MYLFNVLLLLLHASIFFDHPVSTGKVHINRNTFDPVSGQGYRVNQRLPVNQQMLGARPAHLHNAEELPERVHLKQGYGNDRFVAASASNFKNSGKSGYSPSLTAEVTLRRNLGRGIKNRRYRVRADKFRHVGMSTDGVSLIGDIDAERMLSQIRHGQDGRQLFPRLGVNSIKGDAAVQRIAESTKENAHLNDGASAENQLRNNQRHAFLSRVQGLVTGPHPLDNRKIGAASLRSIAYNNEGNNENPSDVAIMNSVVETVHDLPEANENNDSNCRKGVERTKRTVPGMRPCQRETVGLQVEFREHLESEAGPTLLTCRGMEQINKCEGGCDSVAKPSAFYGIQLECSCCKETSTIVREVTLSSCFINGEPVQGHSLTRAILEPTSCACQVCRR